MAISGFTNSFEPVAELRTDRRRLREWVKEVKNPRGDAAFYDSVEDAVDKLAAEQNRRKVLMVVSDSKNNVLQAEGKPPRQGFETMLEHVAKEAITIYTFFPYDWKAEKKMDEEHPGIGGGQFYRFERGQMGKLAEQCGGKLYYTKYDGNVSVGCCMALEEMRMMYCLAYCIPEKKARGKEWRAVRVEVNRPGAIVRTRPGYWME